MLTIRRAVETDCGLIRSLADEVFPATYREIITSSQMDYMMKWMYAPEVLRREMRTGVAWFIASSDGEPCGYLSVQQEAEELFHLQKIYVLPRFQGLGVGEFLFRHAVEYVRSVHPAPCRMELNVNRSNREDGHAQAPRRRFPDRRRLLHERLHHGAGDRIAAPYVSERGAFRRMI